MATLYPSADDVYEGWSKYENGNARSFADNLYQAISDPDGGDGDATLIYTNHNVSTPVAYRCSMGGSSASLETTGPRLKVQARSSNKETPASRAAADGDVSILCHLTLNARVTQTVDGTEHELLNHTVNLEDKWKTFEAALTQSPSGTDNIKVELTTNIVGGNSPLHCWVSWVQLTT